MMTWRDKKDLPETVCKRGGVESGGGGGGWGGGGGGGIWTEEEGNFTGDVTRERKSLENRQNKKGEREKVTKIYQKGQTFQGGTTGGFGDLDSQTGGRVFKKRKKIGKVLRKRTSTQKPGKNWRGTLGEKILGGFTSKEQWKIERRW